MVAFAVLLSACSSAVAPTRQSSASPSVPQHTQEALATKQVQPATPTLPTMAHTPTSTVEQSLPLGVAVGLVPLDVSELDFTNWKLIKGYLGLSDITSRSEPDKLLKLYLSTNQNQASASGFAISYSGPSRIHEKNWGWDAADLDWESTSYAASGPPVSVLRFKDSFDVSPIVSRFEKRNYRKTQYLGANLYTHSMNLSVGWMRKEPLPQILNVAVLKNEHTMIFSSSPDIIRSYVKVASRTAPSLARSPGIPDTIARLDNPAAAIVLPNGEVCADFTVESVIGGRGSPELVEQIKQRRERLARKYGHVHTYVAFGVGYKTENGKPVGTMVMHYPDESSATADLLPRVRLLMHGQSIRTMQSYSKLFKLRHRAVVDSDIVFQLSPTHERPAIFFQVVFQRDLEFASCGNTEKGAPSVLSTTTPESGS